MTRYQLATPGANLYAWALDYWASYFRKFLSVTAAAKT